MRVDVNNPYKIYVYFKLNKYWVFWIEHEKTLLERYDHTDHPSNIQQHRSVKKTFSYHRGSSDFVIVLVCTAWRQHRTQAGKGVVPWYIVHDFVYVEVNSHISLEIRNGSEWKIVALNHLNQSNSIRVNIPPVRIVEYIVSKNHSKYRDILLTGALRTWRRVFTTSHCRAQI